MKRQSEIWQGLRYKDAQTRIIDRQSALERIDRENRSLRRKPKNCLDAGSGLHVGRYLGDCGWWANSAGFVLPADRAPAFTIAVLTNCQPGYDDAIESIEGVATNNSSGPAEKFEANGIPDGF